MTRTSSSATTSVEEAKFLPVHSNNKNENVLLDYRGDRLSSLTSIMPNLDDEQQEEAEKGEKDYKTTGMGLSRNASFDSVTSNDSCTTSFSTRSPVTVLPPLTQPNLGQESTCMDISPTHPSGAWTSNFDNSSRRSAIASEQCVPELQRSSQDSLFNTFNFQEQMLLPDECEQLLASPVGSLPSALEFPPFNRFEDHSCVSTCEDFPSVDDLDCLLPTSSRMCNLPHEPVSKTGDFDETCNMRSASAIQDEFCQEFLFSEKDLYMDQHAARSDPTVLPTAARRRLSWATSEYKMQEPERCSSLPSDLQFNPFDHHAPLTGGMGSIGGLNVSPFLCESQHNLAGPSSLKRSYSTMLLQQPMASSSCSLPIPTFSTSSSSQLKFPSAAGNLSNPASKVVSNLSSDLLPQLLERNETSTSKDEQDVTAFNAMLYKTQGGNASEMMLQLQKAQQAQQACSTSYSSASAIPPPKLRRRHGTATDPQSIAARTRRERFSDRIRILQSLVPHGERLDTVSMLGHTLEYVRFLQHQVWQLYNGNEEATIDSESKEKWKEFMDAQAVVG